MNKGRPRSSEKKRLSIVIVPHSSSHVKVLKFTSLYGKLLAILIAVLVLIAGTGVYIFRTVGENQDLKASLTALHEANAEQKKRLDEKNDKIRQLEEKEAVFDKNVTERLKEIDEQFNQLTEKYISGQSSKASRSGDRSSRGFVDEIKVLKSKLDSINSLYDRLETSKADLSTAESKLDKYMETVPTLWPVDSRISDNFGYRRDPFNGRKKFHEGLDLSGSTGEIIKAAASGRVTLAKSYGGYGRTVIIDHGHGLTTLYGHASKLLVKEGQYVKKGDAIAKVGSSGRSTGPHLHFEVLLYNTPVDPLQYLDKR